MLVMNLNVFHNHYLCLNIIFLGWDHNYIVGGSNFNSYIAIEK